VQSFQSLRDSASLPVRISPLKPKCGLNGLPATDTTARVPRPSRTLRRAGMTMAYTTGSVERTKVAPAAPPPTLETKQGYGTLRGNGAMQRWATRLLAQFASDTMAERGLRRNAIPRFRDTLRNEAVSKNGSYLCSRHQDTAAVCIRLERLKIGGRQLFGNHTRSTLKTC
jgi:hypothetical protein